MLYFITGNKNKLREVQAILPHVEQLSIDLPEIQGLDPEKIIRAKLEEAFQHTNEQGEFIVEDTSLYFDAMNGFPGPLIKWFLEANGNEGAANIVQKLGNTRATAKTIIGYAKSRDEIHFFEGMIKGTIDSPEGASRFGWDPIFRPDGHTKTFASMTPEEKNAISMRRVAVNLLREFLDEQA